MGEENSGPSVLLVHGLFVNADHWRRNMPALAEAGFRVYAIDLLGYGYSSKPPPTGEEARALNGENGRSLGSPTCNSLNTASGEARGAVSHTFLGFITANPTSLADQIPPAPSTSSNLVEPPPNSFKRVQPRQPHQPQGVEVALGHPLGSAYNFYTWAEQCSDFADEVRLG